MKKLLVFVLVLTLCLPCIVACDAIRGEQGIQGEPGPAGVGIEKVEIIDGELFITYTDGRVANAGAVSTQESVDVTTGEETTTVEETTSEETINDKAFYDYNSSDTGKGESILTNFVEREINSMSVEDFVASDKESDYVLVRVKGYGDIVILLRSDVAPKTVANFKKLVKDGFYSGTIFHRIIKNYVIQGGGLESIANTNGIGTTIVQKTADNVVGEFNSNGFTNNLQHIRGVISMARSTNYNSASSQFFIVHKTSPHLDGAYASFGYVLAGMDVVDKIAECDEFIEVGGTMPLNDIVIESVIFVEPK